MAFTTNQEAVAEFYIAALGRSPEKAGLDYWVGRLDGTTGAQLTLDQVRAFFVDSSIPEVATRFPAGQTNQAIVESIYENVLSRAGDADGVAYWVSRIQGTNTDGQPKITDLSEIITHVLGAATAANDAATLANKTTFAEHVYASTATLTAAELSTDSITDDTATLDAATAAVDALEPQTFSLTTSNDDVANGTAANDLFDASVKNSLQTGDIVLDSSSDDNDILNATVTATTAEPRIQNVETVNITGEYVSTGLDLGLSSGITTLNLDTKIAGGTASVLDANSMNAAKIAVGSNIKTLEVTSLTSGTRDAVEIDAGSATTVTLKGSGGPDLYNITTLAADATVSMTVTAGANDMSSAGDELDIVVAGDTTIDFNTQTVANAELDMTITANAADAEITLSGSNKAVAEKITLEGSKDITLIVTNGSELTSTQVAGTPSPVGTAQYDGVAIVDNGTGVSTVQVTGTIAANTSFKEAVVDVIDVAGTITSDITINEATTLNLTNDATVFTLQLDNADKDTLFTTGTALVNVSEAQATAAITTGATVETILITATPDKAIDTDLDENGTHETDMALTGVTLNAATTAVVVNGSNNLNLGTITTGADDQAIAASNLTGNLTIAAISGTHDITVVGGAGDDSITTGNTASGVLDIQTGAGADFVSIGTSAAATTKVNTGIGNDIVTVATNTAAMTFDLGAGDDEITVSANDTVKTGTGADNVVLNNNLAGVVVSDFTKGEDKITLTGATLGVALDLSDLDAPTNGLYKFADTNGTLAANEFHVTLKNGGSALTATDLRDSVALSGVTLFAGSTNVLGDLADAVTMTKGTVTLGGGDDSVTIAAAAAANADATVKDFTVGEDKIIVTGAITVDLSTNLKNVSDVNGKYTIGDATKGANFTLQNGGSNITTDNDLTGIVQLGTSAANFVAENSTDNSTIVNVIGGDFNDFVTLTGKDTVDDQAVYTFSNNGGVDTITLTAGAGQELLNFNSLTGIDTSAGATSKVTLTAGAAKVGDAKDGAVYIFADSTSGTGSAKITTFELDVANGYTQDVIDDEVAAFINAGLGVQNGEKYVVIINDESTHVYGANAYAANASGNTDNKNAYIYLVEGDADGVQSDNITLIGQAIDANSAINSTDIA